MLEKIRKRLSDQKVQKSFLVVLVVALGFSISANMFDKYSPTNGKEAVLKYVDDISSNIAKNATTNNTNLDTYEMKTKACSAELSKLSTNFGPNERSIIIALCTKKIL